MDSSLIKGICAIMRDYDIFSVRVPDSGRFIDILPLLKERILIKANLDDEMKGEAIVRIDQLREKYSV